MIGSLRGSLVDKDPEGEVVLEVAGVGYRISVNPGTLVVLPEIGADVFMHVHHHIREGDQQLYGFATLAERKCFESVIGAHGVGPALALAVLATLPPDEFEGMLRPAFKEDEWILIAVGAALGFVVGVLQLVVFKLIAV